MQTVVPENDPRDRGITGGVGEENRYSRYREVTWAVVRRTCECGCRSPSCADPWPEASRGCDDRWRRCV